MNTFGVRTLLLVDDEPEFLEIVKDCLDDLGVEILRADGPKPAFEHLNRGNIDTVLCDINMPGTTGLDLLAEARGHGHEVPFVFLTGHESLDKAYEALRLGATDFLTKPVARPTLRDAVNRVLEIGVKQREIAQELVNLARNASSETLDTLDRIAHKRKQANLLRVVHNQKRKSS